MYVGKTANVHVLIIFAIEQGAYFKSAHFKIRVSSAKNVGEANVSDWIQYNVTQYLQL